VTIAGHAYVARAFLERGSGGEALDVWVLSSG
jgi:hypothetical protein